jgi:hypothetical protein
MYNSQYTLTIPTLTNTPLSLNLTVPNLSGTNNLFLQFEETDNTGDQIRKFVIEFSDEPGVQHTLQSQLLGTNTIYNLGIPHIFSTSSENPTTYTITITGFRSNYIIDSITLSVNVYQLTLSSLSGLSIVSTNIFDTDTTTNNLLILAETNCPRQIVTFVIPGKG